MRLRLGRYFWKLFLANAAVMAVVLTGCAWMIVSQLDQFRQEELSQHLAAQAAALEVAVRDRFDTAHADELNTVAQQIGSARVEGVRVTFVLTNGAVVGDSQASATRMESHADRPEIRQALSTGRGESVRWSHTVAKYMKYVAVRVGDSEAPLGVVRVSMGVESIAARAQSARRLAVSVAIASVSAAVLLSLVLAWGWSRRIQRVTEAAESMSRGDLSAGVDIQGYDEVALLGRSLNAMRAKLSVHLDTIDRQRRNLESLVSQLRDGVVVIDADARVVLINAEAEAMLHPESAETDRDFVGRSVEQCVPHRKLLDLLDRVGRSDGTDEIELRLPCAKGHRFVLARGFQVRLPNARTGASDTSVPVGRALVLTDITELAHAMQVKADLAANASHELRTPLSAIRASVETLGTLDPQRDPEAIRKFVDVIDRHSERMYAMIGELLELSRLESGADQIDAASVSARQVVDELTKTFAETTTAKGIRWRTECPDEDVTMTTSAELLRMILRNLLDNAVRFTEPGGDVCLSVKADKSDVVFRVTDTGCGIPLPEQDRVFERFYQVEQARSGTERGTGLGLSIVRHAAIAIGARIELKSTPGTGTQVTLRIPCRLTFADASG